MYTANINIDTLMVNLQYPVDIWIMLQNIHISRLFLCHNKYINCKYKSMEKTFSGRAENRSSLDTDRMHMAIHQALEKFEVSVYRYMYVCSTVTTYDYKF